MFILFTDTTSAGDNHLGVFLSKRSLCLSQAVYRLLLDFGNLYVPWFCHNTDIMHAIHNVSQNPLFPHSIAPSILSLSKISHPIRGLLYTPPVTAIYPFSQSSVPPHKSVKVHRRPEGTPALVQSRRNKKQYLRSISKRSGRTSQTDAIQF